MSDISSTPSPSFREVLVRYWIGIAVMLAIAFFVGLGFGFQQGFRSGTGFTVRKVLTIAGVINFSDSKIFSVNTAGNNATVYFDGITSSVPASMRIDYVDAKTNQIIKSEVITVKGIPEGKPRIDLKTPEHPGLILIEIRRN